MVSLLMADLWCVSSGGWKSVKKCDALFVAVDIFQALLSTNLQKYHRCVYLFTITRGKCSSLFVLCSSMVLFLLV